ncbi:unnamed protein product [Albugo candida]|uniref:RecQ-mediated genome instability protein 1 n=1 Tax=Albugo candida TaxID=65357 RepID=A0A024G2J1_9STRA|nr:unnamed protein product [Albugo candida]|eukprot:CCI40866.1 unnamed protein product [Albugo candida]
MKRWYRAINPVWEQSQREVFERTYHNSILPSSESSDADSWEGFLAAKFLQTDLALCSLPVLPDVTSMHNDTLQGCYIVQVATITNIGANYKLRTENSNFPNRTLKIGFTDGTLMAYRHLPQFSIRLSTGSKVILRDVDIRHGLLLLTPQNCHILDIHHTIPSIPNESEYRVTSSFQETSSRRTGNGQKSNGIATTSSDEVSKQCLMDSSVNVSPLTTQSADGQMPKFSRKRLRSDEIIDVEPTDDTNNDRLPFQYFSSRNPIYSIQMTKMERTECQIKACIKSVAAFDFQDGTYKLHVVIEDATSPTTARVDPAFVEEMMGVSCAEFTTMLEHEPQVAHQWAANMQFALMILEGIMTFRFESTESEPVLMSCRAVQSSDLDQLLCRIECHQSASNG